MGFDPLTWALGFVLSKSGSWILGNIFSESLPNKLSNELDTWAKNLPRDFEVYPAAMFPKYEMESDKDKFPKLNELRKILEEERIPTMEKWHDALTEHYIIVKENFGKNAQPFFQHNIEEVNSHILKLASQFEAIIRKDEELFRTETLATLKEIVAKQDESILLGSSKQELEKKANLLSVLANELKECIEKSEQMVIASGYGPERIPIDSSPIELTSFEHIIKDLIRANIFSPLEWSSINKIPYNVKEVNHFNSNKSRVVAGTRIYWAVVYFDTLWLLVVTKFLKYGGVYNDLIKPMRFENLEETLIKSQQNRKRK